MTFNERWQLLSLTYILEYLIYKEVMPNNYKILPLKQINIIDNAPDACLVKIDENGQINEILATIQFKFRKHEELVYLPKFISEQIETYKNTNIIIFSFIKEDLIDKQLQDLNNNEYGLKMSNTYGITLENQNNLGVIDYLPLKDVQKSFNIAMDNNNEKNPEKENPKINGFICKQLAVNYDSHYSDNKYNINLRNKFIEDFIDKDKKIQKNLDIIDKHTQEFKKNLTKE
jgi:hypothetical protein